MKLFIPKLGTELTLLEPWTFKLYNENRNASLIQLVGYTVPDPPKGMASNDAFWWRRNVHWPHTFPAKSVLIVDRIYIRQGQDDFDSVTFRAKYYHSSQQTGFGKKGKMVRFWAKLDDVNTMQVEDL